MSEPISISLPKTDRPQVLYQATLIACALVLLVNSYELTFAIWFLCAGLTLRRTYSLSFARLLLILVAIIAVAFISSLFREFQAFKFFRDLAYLMKPILGLLIGYNFCRILGKKALTTIIYAGLALAVIHVSTLIFYYVFGGIKNMNALRHLGGYFDDLEVYVLILLIFRKKLAIDISPKIAKAALLIVAVSSFLYFARTNILQFLILFVAMKGYLRLTKRSLRVVAILAVSVIAAYTAIYQSNPRRGGKGLEAFLYKIKIAPIEPFKTKINEDDWKDFNDNYRSFENIITVRQVTGAGWPTTFFGKGLGSTIDIGREMWTNDEEYIRYIPTLHNAYMSVFLKAGLVGVLLTIIFIYYLFRHTRSYDEQIRHYNYILVGSAVYLILSNWVFMGLYLKLDNKSIVLGALLCYRGILIKQSEAKGNE
ncbi:MAG TPA: hypothetical protein VGB50_13390 [Flavobacterium sp.]|jgi:hypothetical protein